MAAASSLSNFTRTLAGSIGTSITTTLWTNRESMHHAQLTEAVNAQDWETAFRASHTLKGVAQNLGFDGLYRAAFALTEEMRGGKPLTDITCLQNGTRIHASR